MKNPFKSSMAPLLLNPEWIGKTWLKCKKSERE